MTSRPRTHKKYKRFKIFPPTASDSEDDMADNGIWWDNVVPYKLRRTKLFKSRAVKNEPYPIDKLEKESKVPRDSRGKICKPKLMKYVPSVINTLDVEHEKENMKPGKEKHNERKKSRHQTKAKKAKKITEIESARQETLEVKGIDETDMARLEAQEAEMKINLKESLVSRVDKIAEMEEALTESLLELELEAEEIAAMETVLNESLVPRLGEQFIIWANASNEALAEDGKLIAMKDRPCENEKQTLEVEPEIVGNRSSEKEDLTSGSSISSALPNTTLEPQNAEKKEVPTGMTEKHVLSVKESPLVEPEVKGIVMNQIDAVKSLKPRTPKLMKYIPPINKSPGVVPRIEEITSKTRSKRVRHSRRSRSSKKFLFSLNEVTAIEPQTVEKEPIAGSSINSILPVEEAMDIEPQAVEKEPTAGSSTNTVLPLDIEPQTAEKEQLTTGPSINSVLPIKEPDTDLQTAEKEVPTEMTQTAVLSVEETPLVEPDVNQIVKDVGSRKPRTPKLMKYIPPVNKSPGAEPQTEEIISKARSKRVRPSRGSSKKSVLPLKKVTAIETQTAEKEELTTGSSINFLIPVEEAMDIEPQTVEKELTTGSSINYVLHNRETDTEPHNREKNELPTGMAQTPVLSVEETPLVEPDVNQIVKDVGSRKPRTPKLMKYIPPVNKSPGAEPQTKEIPLKPRSEKLRHSRRSSKKSVLPSKGGTRVEPLSMKQNPEELDLGSSKTPVLAVPVVKEATDMEPRNAEKVEDELISDSDTELIDIDEDSATCSSTISIPDEYLRRYGRLLPDLAENSSKIEDEPKNTHEIIRRFWQNIFENFQALLAWYANSF